MAHTQLKPAPKLPRRADRKRRRRRRPPRLRPTRAEMSVATGAASTHSRLNKLDTEVSLVLDGSGRFDRGGGGAGTRTQTRLIAWPRSAFRCGWRRAGDRNCSCWPLLGPATALISSEKTQAPGELKQTGEDDDDAKLSGKPMISINVSEPPTGGQSGNDDDDDGDDEASGSARRKDRKRKDKERQQQELARDESGANAAADNSLVCDVENVRLNFVSLIEHNKFLYFYLATLIYSVINLGLILCYSSATLKSETSATPTPTTAAQQQRANIVNISQTNCRPEGADWQQPDDDDKLGDELLIGANFLRLAKWFVAPAICTLVLVIFVITIDFNSPRRHRHRRRLIIVGLCRILGQLVALLLLNLPFALFLLHRATILRSHSRPLTNDYLADQDCNYDRQHHQSASRLSLAALLAALYLQSFFIGGGGDGAGRSCSPLLGAKIICLLEILVQVLAVLWFGSQIDGGAAVNIHENFPQPPLAEERPRHLAATRPNDPLQVITMVADGHQQPKMNGSSSSQWLLLVGLCLVPVLVLGALRRRRFARSISRDTFRGAAHLIEAKVSLEHQRQQQETLLLSVLPAYVAEQVKRNMLKKTTTTTTTTTTTNNNNSGHSSEPGCGLAPPDAPSMTIHSGPHQAHSPLQKSPANSVSYLKSSASGSNQPPQMSPLPQHISHSRSIGVIQQISAKKLVVTSTNNNNNSSGDADKQTQSRLVSLKRESSSSLKLRQPGEAKRTVERSGSASQQATANLAAAGLPGSGGQLTAAPTLTLGFGQSALLAPGPVSPSFGGQQQQLQGGARRGFNELYIRTYNNVSLLYGDIVGFTRLCTQLSSSQLVRVLNDLFSHFDHLAEKHKIMRIKILGDCYYGVSGIPEFAVMGAKSRAHRNENHAINCVNMGLDMISYIKCLNVERSAAAAASASEQSAVAVAPLSHSASGQPLAHQVQQPPNEKQTMAAGRRKSSVCSVSGSRSAETFSELGQQQRRQQQQRQKAEGEIQSPLPVFELNMRIGVHSGHIHSGVIGLKKWQFDVWSNDVSIAMHCESSGTAGRVQVTEATVLQLNGAFSFEEARASERDSFLATKGIRTFLIRDKTGASIQHAAASATPSPSANQPRPSSGAERSALEPTDKERAGARQQEQQHRHRLLKESIERVEKDLASRLDEDNIRAATIGTIRQTLLTGESCNASGCNSLGLALDHGDLRPLALDFRDPILAKLYKNRLTKSLTSESCAIFLLLLILLPSIDYLLFGLFNNSTASKQERDNLGAVLLGTSVLCSLFLAAAALWPRIWARISRKIVFSHHRNAGSVVMASSSSSSSPSAHSARSTRPKSADSDTNLHSHRKNQSPSILAGVNMNNSHHPEAAQSAKLMLRARNYLRTYCNLIARSRFNPIRSTSGTRTCKFRSFTVFLVFSIVIAMHVYLIFTQRYCASDRAGQEEKADRAGFGRLISMEAHHVTVIFVLVCLDSSVNSLGLRSKSAIVLLVVCLNILFSFRTNFLLDELAAKYARIQQHAIFCQLKSTGPDPLGNGKQTRFDSEDSMPPRQSSGELDSVQTLIDWSTSALVIIVALLSVAYARQLEYTNRANFLWRNRLAVDHEELEYISGINKVLLENILPSHVVEHYMSQPSNEPQQQQVHHHHHQLTLGSGGGRLPALQNYMRMSFSNMRNSSAELYHEQHESVAVMFASIPHFYEFYDESDISKQGLGCIALLNEIICDFDKLLLKNKFSRIEKIKTIGSTYMAAAGLRPSYCANSRSSTVSAHTPTYGQQNPNSLPAATTTDPTSMLTVNNNTNPLLSSPSTSEEQTAAKIKATSRSQAEKLNLVCMIQFATSLMSALNGINKQSFQGFKLRVGVNSGSVIAGIIGAQRPFYDIWGDCVNIASRMDSLGETGRIQVEERTAQLLMECLCADTYSIVRRGPIEVKGKGGMVTYFVDKRQPDQQLAAPAATIVAPQQRSSAARSSCDGDDRGADVRRLMSTRSGGSVGQTAGEFFSRAC